MFSNKSTHLNQHQLKFDEILINIENQGKFLGITIDKKLSFKDHSNSICNKLSNLRILVDTLLVLLKLVKFSGKLLFVSNSRSILIG